MDISSVQSQVQVSMMKKQMDAQTEMAAKLLDSMDQTSAAIEQASEPGKGRFIDVRV